VPVKSEDLHGNAPDQSPVVLLIIDVINDLEYEGGEELLRYGKPMAQSIRALKDSARKSGIPAIYVNDNFGKWRSDFKAQVRHCLEEDVRGKPLAELLRPEEDDYFVQKPKHSGFFSTTLALLLKHLGAKVLILTGIAGNSCILFTAADAYMRDYEMIVPADCVVSIDPEDNKQALELMRKVLKADTRPSGELSLADLLEKNRTGNLKV
jgi:nicotinamidase-related amidase